MKTLSDIPSDIATEAAAFFLSDENYRLSLATAGKIFTPREQERLFRELSERGTPEAAALVFVVRAANYSHIDGFNYMQKHAIETLSNNVMMRAVESITNAINQALEIPLMWDKLSKVQLRCEEGMEWEGDKRLKVMAVYPCPTLCPQPKNLPALMTLLKDQLQLVETENKKGPKEKIHRRGIVKKLAGIWEVTTGEAPTISEGCGFLYAMEIIWNATARSVHSYMERNQVRGYRPEYLKLGKHDLRNELRAILKEKKETSV